MRQSRLILLAIVISLFPAWVQTDAVSSQTRNAAAEAAALEASNGILTLAADRDFNAMYDRIHPDAHALIPRVAAVKTFEAAYEAADVGQGETTNVTFIDWTWPVNDRNYPNAAEVTFQQPAIDPDTGENVTFEDTMYLVESEGTWRWFFGNSRAFVAEAIAKYSPPPPSEETRDTPTLLENVVNDLDGFYRDSFETTEYTYESPGVVAVSEGDAADSGCGLAQPGFWAFYCPLDQTIYLDIPFLTDLDQRYGDFAAAFVVSHEWAHHAQTSLGIERSEFPSGFNQVYSIQLELMADCFAGVWTLDADTRGLIELDDIVEAMAFTNERLGDPDGIDPTNPQAHGTAAQRLDWFQDGFTNGFEGCGEIM